MNFGFIIGMVISIILARWVRGDAVDYEERGMQVSPFGHTAWAVTVFLLWIVFLPWYLIARSRTTAPPPAV